MGSFETSVTICHSIQPDISEELSPIRAAKRNSILAKIALRVQNESETLCGLRLIHIAIVVRVSVMGVLRSALRTA